VGSNLYVSGDSSDVLTVDGNVVCEGVKVGLIEITPSYDLAAVSNVGNVTSNTIQFTNPDTGIVATGNVTVGSTLTVSGFRITAQAEANDDLEAITLAGADTTQAIHITNDTDSESPHSGALQIGTGTGAFGGLGVAGNVHVGRGLFVDTDTLVVDSTNNRVGIGKTNPDATLDVDGDAIIRGDLSVLGTTTTIDTDNLRVQDPIIELGKDNAGTGDLGLVMTRPSGSSNVAVIFDESADTLEIGYTQNNASDTDITMDSTPLSVNVNGNLSVTSNVEVGTANLFVDTVNSRVGIGTTEPVSGLTVFRDIESANSFITERVLFKETWPNGHNSLIGDLGTWVVTNANLQGNPTGGTTTPDGYTLVAINGDGSANGEFVSPAFDLSDYALSDGVLPATDKRKTTTRVFLKCFFSTRSLTLSDEVAQVQFSPDNGSTWYTVATSQDENNTIRFTMLSADLSPYILDTSTQAKIRFYMPWTVGNGDYMRVGRIWIHESDVPTNLGGMWLGAGGNIGIGTTNPGSALDIYKEDTTAAGQTVISSITGVFSGSDATGGNINNKGLLINLDSSATGGGTSSNNPAEEHRVWGIDVDIDVTGDSDDIKGGRFLVRSEMAANGIDQNTNIYGIDAQGQHNGTGLCTNIIGVNARSFKGTSSTGFTDTMIGVQAEHEINAGTCTDAYAVRSRFDRNGGAVTNSYLFYGDHVGSATTITNNYGLYVTGADKHYLEGNVGIGTADPGARLHVNGDIAVGVDGSLRRTADNDLINIYAGSDNTSPYMFMTGKNRSSNANKIGFRIENNAKLEIYTDKIFIADRVGIGYSAPDSKLDLRNTVIYNGETSTDFNPGTMGLLEFWAANTTATRWNMTVHENNDLYFLCRTSGSGAGSWHQVGYLKDNTPVDNIDFTGQHRNFIDGIPATNYTDFEGLIVSANKNKYFDINENITTGANAIQISQSLPLVSLSSKEKDKACFGVISGSEDPESREYVQGSYVSVIRKQKGDTRAFINSVGEGGIWVVNTNGSLESGDYITTSNVAGYGQKQDSEFLANYTVAKITMDCDFDPVTQPVQIIRKETSDVNYWVKTTYENVSEEEYSNLTEENRRTITETAYTNEDGETFTEQNEQSTYTELEQTTYQKITKEESKTEQEGWELEVRQELVNVLDEHGQLQWEDDPSGATEKAYKIRYLDADGNITDEANAVHKAAFVGCTYHCG
jgi:hypothetical protein